MEIESTLEVDIVDEDFYMGVVAVLMAHKIALVAILNDQGLSEDAVIEELYRKVEDPLMRAQAFAMAEEFISTAKEHVEEVLTSPIQAASA
jgi:hypothetical protein